MMFDDDPVSDTKNIARACACLKIIKDPCVFVYPKGNLTQLFQKLLVPAWGQKCFYIGLSGCVSLF